MNNYSKRFFSVTLLLLSISASSVMAQTLAEQLMTRQEKVAEMEGHKAALSAGASSESSKNSDAKVQFEKGKLEKAKPEKTELEIINAKKASPLARALAQSDNQLSTDSYRSDKTLTLTISELRDSSGLVYLGGKVSEVELTGYLAQLMAELGEEQYAIYRQYQAARDQQSFHVTLVNPYEYQTINKAKLKPAEKIRVTLHGLGKVAQGDKTSYFVVLSSSDGQYLRQNLLLNNKDFHITLGFYPEDVYGVNKGLDTLINK